MIGNLTRYKKEKQQFEVRRISSKFQVAFINSSLSVKQKKTDPENLHVQISIR